MFIFQFMQENSMPKWMRAAQDEPIILKKPDFRLSYDGKKFSIMAETGLQDLAGYNRQNMKKGKAPKILGGEEMVRIDNDTDVDIAPNKIYYIGIDVNGFGTGKLYMKFENFGEDAYHAKVADLYIKYEFDSGAKTDWTAYPKNPIEIDGACGASMNLNLNGTIIGHMKVCIGKLHLNITVKTDAPEGETWMMKQPLELAMRNEVLRNGERIRFGMNSEKEHGNVEVSMVDSAGRNYAVADISIGRGENEVGFDLPHGTPAGAYTIVVKAEDGAMAQGKILLIP